MIVYWIEIWCNACNGKFHPWPVTIYEQVPWNCEWLVEMAQEQGWVADGSEIFCPKCQVQRKAG